MWGVLKLAIIKQDPYESRPCIHSTLHLDTGIE